MNKELAKTLTVALVNYIDVNIPEGTMDCSSAECESIEKMFEGDQFDIIEAFIQKKLSGLTEFEESLRQIIVKALSGETPNGSGGTMSWAVALSDDDIKKLAPKVLALAKKELLSYADESNPAIEAMADLERTFECNPEKLPQWLKDKLAKKHLEGYIKGKEDTEKRYNGIVEYHLPIMPTPPSGWGCDGTHCTNPHHDCINCPAQYSSGGTITTPNSASGTSTLKAEG